MAVNDRRSRERRIRWRVVSLLFVGALGAAVGRGAFPVASVADEAEGALIEPGSTLPDIDMFDMRGQRQSLGDVVKRERPNFLVVLSARCHTCLGELASWREEVQARPALRPVVVVETADPGYLAYVDRLIRPTYGIYRIDAFSMEELGALATPVAYRLYGGGEVVDAAIGSKSVLELRSGWEQAGRR